MTQEEFVAKIREQINEGEKLLERFGDLKSTQVQRIEEFRVITFGKRHYDEKIKSALESDLLMWVDGVRIILSSRWGKSHPQRVRKIEITEPRLWFDFKDIGINFLRKNITVLKSFVRNYSLVDDYDNTPDPDIEETESSQWNRPTSGDRGHTYNINAVNANVGDGTISTGDISGNELTQYVSNETKEKLSHVINEITEKAKDLNNQEILEYAQNVQQELEKPQSEKKTIRMFLNAINGVATVIGNAAIQELVSQGIGLLF